MGDNVAVGRDLEPARSTLAKLDDALLVAVLIVLAIGAIQVISWIAGTILFLLKVALVVAVAAAGYAWVRSRR